MSEFLAQAISVRVDGPEYMTTTEVADLLRTPSETVRFWRHVGKGPRSFKVGRRVLYARADVLDYVRAARAGDAA
jgi:excisionase family DNA binding protein